MAAPQRCVGLPDDVAQADPQVVTDHPVHADLLIGAGVVGQDDAHRLPPLLSLHQNCVSTEQLQFVHLGLHGKKINNKPINTSLIKILTSHNIKR